MAKSKFFRVAVEGMTADGRTIERDWLAQAAETYKPETYSARVNMEHIRGFSADAPFKAYGDVLALKTGDVELELAGKTEKRLALFAQIDATDDLVSLNRDRQKLFTSCEIAPNFAGSGKAYLVGLAVTDTPASLGTEMLAFAAGAGDKSPLAGRKQDAANLFTAADENELELELELEAGDDADNPATIRGLVELTLAAVAKLTGKAPANDDKPAETTTPPPPSGEQPANDNVELAALAGAVTSLTSAVEASNTANAEAVTALTATVDELKAKLDTAPEQLKRRPRAAGGNGAIRSDC